MISKTVIPVSIALLWIACSGKAIAQESVNTPEPSNWQVQLQLDNDLFAGSDRDYTNGVRLGFVREIPLASERGQKLYRRVRDGSKKIQRSLQNFGMDEDDNYRFAEGYGINQLMFTPEDPTALTAPEGERPYAGWLGLEYSLHIKEGDHVNSITLSLGTTGDSSLAQTSQDWVHRNISDSPLFQGWDSQVPSELTLNVHYDHKRKFTSLPKFTRGDLKLDGYYEFGFAAGNFRTDAYIGGLARFGYRLPSNFSTPRVQIGSYGHQFFKEDNKNYGNKISAFAFAGLRATTVLHDITLDGPVFRDFDTGVESKPLVGELLYGVGFKYRKVDMAFSQTVRSDEFDGQRENQRFGSFMLRFQSWFR